MSDYTLPEVPLRYLIMKWRLRTNTSYQDAMLTPYDAILADMQMLDIEGEFGPR